MFGRRRGGRHARGRSQPGFTLPPNQNGWTPAAPREPEPVPGPMAGPFDSERAPADGVPRLDLGSIRLPVPEGAGFHVETEQTGAVLAVHVLTAVGQLTVNAFAAPRGGELWSEARHELIAQLRADGMRVSVETGEWDREVIAVRPDLALRFIGVNGPRWLLRGVAAGSPVDAPALAEQLRRMLRGTIVVRGAEPMPVQALLPLTLPERMAERLEQTASRADYSGYESGYESSYESGYEDRGGYRPN